MPASQVRAPLSVCPIRAPNGVYGLGIYKDKSFSLSNIY